VATRSAERPPRHLAAGASINVAAQVATIAAAGVTSVAVARLLGPTGTGTLALAVTLVAVSTTVFSLGLRSGVIYRVSRGAWAPRAAVRAAAASALVLGAIGAILGLGFYALTSGTVLHGLSPTMAIVTFASLPFALVWLFIAAVALAVERYEVYGAITIVQPVAQVVLAVILAATVGTLGAVIGFAIWGLALRFRGWCRPLPPPSCFAGARPARHRPRGRASSAPRRASGCSRGVRRCCRTSTTGSTCSCSTPSV
jgi:O-antigen/teichoic acid export membrane protein